jgi:hypothetical protein
MQLSERKLMGFGSPAPISILVVSKLLRPGFGFGKARLACRWRIRGLFRIMNVS